MCNVRWKIEEFRRKLKHLKELKLISVAKREFNAVTLLVLIWSRLKVVVHKTSKTVYQIKHGMLSDYLIEQLKHPLVKMTFV